MDPLVSIVVPVLADLDAATVLLSQIAEDPAVEVIIVDGGHEASLDGLTEARADTRVIRSQPGRARQMNEGAAVARGDWLVFLHADSQLPGGWLDRLQAAPAGAVGGWFEFALNDSSWQARLIERGVRWRVRFLRLPYGDQGLFVRRSMFARLGGYREWPLLEDVDFARRLVSAGPVFELGLPLLTSARRWRRDGWFGRSSRNLALVLCYLAGVSPAWLARRYSKT